MYIQQDGQITNRIQRQTEMSMKWLLLYMYKTSPEIKLFNLQVSNIIFKGKRKYIICVNVCNDRHNWQGLNYPIFSSVFRKMNEQHL